jgi:methionyl-tRNA formyltransferase
VLTPPPIKSIANDLGIELIQPARLTTADAMGQLRTWAPDAIVVAAFGQILKPELLALPPLGCVNVHASLLPRWRGAAPIQAAVAAGDAETGVTIMKMDEGVDSGGILAQRDIAIAPGDTAGSLSERLADLGAELLLETLPRYISGEVEPRPQDGRRATKAPMLKKEDALLDFKRTASALERRVRAFNPWPGAYFVFEGQPLKVHGAHVEQGSMPVGTRLVHQGMPAIGAEGGILVLDEVQPAGKKPMSGRAFVAGARNWLS